jgi:hypothetical protein
MKGHNVISRLLRTNTATLLALILSVAALTGCPSDKTANDNRTPEQKKVERQKQIVRAVASSFDIAATALESGIATVRSLRRSGEVMPADALRMARLGQRGNAIALAAAENIARLDEIGGGDVATLVENLLVTAQQLNSEGMLVIKGRSQLIFTGITTGSLIFLRTQGDDLQKMVDEGGELKLLLDADSRRKLDRAVKTMKRNAEEFAASIAELEPKAGQ